MAFKRTGEAAAGAGPGSLRLAARQHSRGYFARSWQRFRRNKLSIASAIVFLIMVAFSFGAPLISKYVTKQDYAAQNLLNTFAEPGETVTGINLSRPADGPVTHTHWLGSDELGRDVLTRLAYGGRISLTVAFITMALALTFGVLVGAVAGYYGGWVDALLMRIVDTFISVPGLFLLILIASMLNNNRTLINSDLYNRAGWLVLPVVIAAVSWTGISRLVRGEFLALKHRDFIEAARVLGANDRRILFRHILPNITHVLIIWVTLIIPIVILSEASLSYLGFGVQVPTPSWGNMLTNATQYVSSARHLIIIPGLAIYITVLSVHLMGNGLRDALDPRLND